jgi:hypothetical protein
VQSPVFLMIQHEALPIQPFADGAPVTLVERAFN